MTVGETEPRPLREIVLFSEACTFEADVHSIFQFLVEASVHIIFQFLVKASVLSLGHTVR